MEDFMKKLLFLSLFITAFANSVEITLKLEDLELSSEFQKLTELAIKKIVEQYDFESVLQFIDEEGAGDENLKLAASRYWYQLNKENLFKIASQKYNITPEHTLNGHAWSITSIAIYNDKVVTGSDDKTAIIWNLNTGKQLHTLNGHTNNCIRLVAISGDKVVTGSWDKTAIIWDLNTGKQLHILNGHTDCMLSVAISGDKVVTGSCDMTAIIWNLNTGKQLHTLKGHTDCIRLVAISGDKVVTGSDDETAIIWNLNTGKQLHTLKGHTDRLWSVAISDDKVVTGSYDETAIIWDLNTGKQLHTLNGHTAWIRLVAISGDKVVTGSCDKTAIIWNLNQPITQLLSDETGPITFDSLIEMDKKLHKINDEIAGPATN